MTLADAVILPFNVTHYGDNMKVFNTKIMEDFKDDFKNYSVQNELGMSKSFHKFIIVSVSTYKVTWPVSA